MKVEGATPAARKQFRRDEKKRHQSLEVEEEKLAMQGTGKILVTKELMIAAKPESKGVAGVATIPRSIGRGRGRRREKVEVNDDSAWLSLQT